MNAQCSFPGRLWGKGEKERSRKIKHLAYGSWPVKTSSHPHLGRSWGLLSVEATWHSFGYGGSVCAYMCMCACIYKMHVWENCGWFFFFNLINLSSQAGWGSSLKDHRNIHDLSRGCQLPRWFLGHVMSFPPPFHSERQVSKEDLEYPSLVTVFKPRSWHMKTGCWAWDFLSPESLPFSLLPRVASWWDMEAKEFFCSVLKNNVHYVITPRRH